MLQQMFHLHYAFRVRLSFCFFILWILHLTDFCYVAAIISLGFMIIHTFSMVIAFNAYAEGRKLDQIIIPIIHILAAVMVSI